ncbi:MAG TPA: hypothetical protein VFE47_18100 [Tepidisphaeraceae bacterium]|nr:hypothetical protein [Tepidisphaeraceae bacterium]
MKKMFVSHAHLRARAANLPEGFGAFAASLDAATLEVTPEGTWFDADRHPAFAKVPVLLGDRLAGIAEAMGVNHAMKLLLRITGKPCCCECRRKLLNRLHARLIARRVKAESKGIKPPVDRHSKPR